MKKFVASLIVAIMAIMTLSFIASPANASIPSTTVTICHYDNGQGGKFNQIQVSEHSVVKKTDAFLGHGKHADDIIPPFEYNFGGNDHGTFPGLNWENLENNQTLWKNACNPAGNPLAPVIPADLQATCVDKTPILNLPAQPAGVTATAELKNGSYVVTYTKPADTPYNSFWFPENFTNHVTVKIIPAGPGDEFWDVTLGKCNLPDTGAGGISSSALMFGGIALGIGLVATAVSPLIRKRNA